MLHVLGHILTATSAGTRMAWLRLPASGFRGFFRLSVGQAQATFVGLRLQVVPTTETCYPQQFFSSKKHTRKYEDAGYSVN
jgi:hypothetical protein